MSMKAACAVAVYMTCLSVDAVAQTPTLRELERGLKARESAVRNFHVKADFREKFRSRYTGKYLDSATSTEVVIDPPSQRFWYRKVGQMYNAPGGEIHDGQEYLSIIQEVMAFDGERTRQLTWSSDEKDPDMEVATRVGTIFPNRTEYWLIDPRDFVSDFLREPASAHIGRGERRVVGVDPSDGTAEFEGWNERSDKVKFRLRLWIDFRRGMVAVRREMSIQHPGETRWTPYYKSRLEDLVEIQKGIWLPQKYYEETQQVLPNKPPFLMSSQVVTLSDWAINQDLPTSRFLVSFPAGTMVRDQRFGTAYRTKVISDHAAEQSSKIAMDMRESFIRSQSNPLPSPGLGVPPWVWPATMTAVLVTATAAVYVRSRRRLKGTS